MKTDNLVYFDNPTRNKIQVSLNTEKTNEYCTWRRAYIHVNIWLDSCQNEKCVRQICRDNQNTF